MDTKTKVLIVLAVIVGGAGLFNNIKSRDVRLKSPSNIAPQPTNSELLLSKKSTEIVTSDVVYFQDVNGTNITGLYAYPKKSGNYPGIVMIHEWWGLNNNIKDMAKELAKEGYKVLAVDLYKGKVAQSPEEARELVSSVNDQESIANLKAAVAFLESNNAPRIASLGWCFGGGQSLQLSLNEPVDATVIYYGTPLITDKTQLASLGGPVLGIFGDKDMAIPVAKVNEFQTYLNELNIKNEVIIYPGVGHAFANPSGSTWSPKTTREAWSVTLKFLEENLRSN